MLCSQFLTNRQNDKKMAARYCRDRILDYHLDGKIRRKWGRLGVSSEERHHFPLRACCDREKLQKALREENS